MKLLVLKFIVSFLMVSVVACSQTEKAPDNTATPETKAKKQSNKPKEHRYGSWYCPDNLNGFPAVDIKDWKTVPVVNGRMATKEETQNGTSLIDVDLEKFPDAKVLDITLPQLARYYNRSSGKEEFVIIIQALIIVNDSVVGFRYLNGGNGSAWLHEVDFVSEEDINELPDWRFVSIDLSINASEAEVWAILTDTSKTHLFMDVLGNSPLPTTLWRSKTNVNFYAPNVGSVTGQFASNHYGMKYIQNDYEQIGKHYVEKILLHQNENRSELKMVFGPFASDYNLQQLRIKRWAKRVKSLSESL